MSEISSKDGLREKISDLIGSTNVRRRDETEFELIFNNVTVNVEVFGELVKNGIGGDVDDNIVVAPEGDRQRNRDMEFPQHIGDLEELANSRGHAAILSLSW
ncbi:UNVERIFIED_CONTAM: hypothetical protein Sindi_2466700 [Sesamum indicum]